MPLLLATDVSGKGVSAPDESSAEHEFLSTLLPLIATPHDDANDQDNNDDDKVNDENDARPHPETTASTMTGKSREGAPSTSTLPHTADITALSLLDEDGYHGIKLTTNAAGVDVEYLLIPFLNSPIHVYAMAIDIVNLWCGNEIMAMQLTKEFDALEEYLYLVHVLQTVYGWDGERCLSARGCLIMGELFTEYSLQCSLRDEKSVAGASVMAMRDPGNPNNTLGKTPVAAPMATIDDRAKRPQQTGNPLAMSTNDMHWHAMKWLSTFRAHTALNNEAVASFLTSNPHNIYGCNDDGSPGTSDNDKYKIEQQVRYWWWTGILYTAMKQRTKASECFKACRAFLLAFSPDATLHSQLQRYGGLSSRPEDVPVAASSVSMPSSSAFPSISLLHCTMHTSITLSSIDEQVDVLRLDEDLPKTKILVSQGKHLEAAALLSQAVFSGSVKKERFIHAVHRSEWINALRLLLDIADKNNDDILALRCHLRLLNTAVPEPPGSMQSILDECIPSTSKRGRESIVPIIQASHRPSSSSSWSSKRVGTSHAATAVATAGHTWYKTVLHSILYDSREDSSRHEDTGNNDQGDGAALLTKDSLKDISRAAAFFASAHTSLASKLAPIQSNDKKGSSTLLHAMEWRMLRSSLQRLIITIHSCAFFLKSNMPDTVQSTSNVTTLTRRKAVRSLLSDASAVSLCLWNIDPDAVHTPSAVLDWSYCLTEVLGTVNALSERRAVVVRLVYGLMRDALRCSKELHAADAGSTVGAGAEDGEAIASSLRCGMCYCIYWLYGVQLPDMDIEPWGGDFKTEDLPATGFLSLSTQDQVLEIWPVVEEYFLNLTPASLKKKSYKEFLEIVTKLFAELPQGISRLLSDVWTSMMAAPPPMDFSCYCHHHGSENDSTAAENDASIKHVIGRVESMPRALREMIGTGVTSLPSDRVDSGDGPATTSWVKYLPVYRSLYHLQTVTMDFTKMLDASPCHGSMLVPASMDVFHSFLAPYQRSLLFDSIAASEAAPPGITSERALHSEKWQSLAVMCQRIASLLREEASEYIDGADWHHRIDVQVRDTMLFRYAQWCAFFAYRFSSTVLEKVGVLELAAQACFDRMHGLPSLLPSHSDIDADLCRDSENDDVFVGALSDMEKKGLHGDTALLHYARTALKLYDLAIQESPIEWSFYLQKARCMIKLGRPHEEYIPCMAFACHLSKVFFGGLLEPFCALHAERLKLLRRHAARNALDDALVELLIKYSFNPVDAPEMDCDGVAAAAAAIEKDIDAALAWCMEKDKFYYEPIIMYACCLVKTHTKKNSSYCIQVHTFTCLFASYMI